MKLLIVESPAKAKTIEKYLENKYTVKASVGHIRDLPKSNSKAIDIEGGYIPHYEITKGKKAVVDELQKLSDKADEIILATDPDREGEAIAWHISQALGLDKKDVKRIVFNEITKEAVNEALKHPRDIDTDLRKAQEARRVLDRLFGYGLSGLIWKKIRYGLSAGRVQSPALRILMEKEREIEAFVPEKYFVLSADFETKNKDRVTLECDEEPRDEELAEKIYELGNKEKWSVVDIKETEAKKASRAPFTTSTLQQAASSRYGFSPSRTMGIAQKLYEAGHITYMRTDSTNLSDGAIGAISALIQKEYGKEYLEVKKWKTKSKNAQEAHEAIRPTHVNMKNIGTTEEQKKLYGLIWERTVASQMAPAKILKTKVSANIQNGDIPNFSIIGSHVLFPGWLAADKGSRGEDVELPKMKVGDALSLIEMHKEQKFTTPPDRYSEAGLVKELEKRGIGRPSTYASIVKTIQDRGYVDKVGRALVPTDTGKVVNNFLEEYFSKYISDNFTAHMEDELDEIAMGKMEYEKAMDEFYKPFVKELRSKESLGKMTNMGEADPSITCPICGGPMVIKLSKGGKFLSCAKFPDCQGSRTIEGIELEPPKETGELCPKCGEKKGGKLIEREGRFGKFISCNRYPKCKFIKNDEESEKKKMTGVECNVCKKGEMMERRGRFGLFYSCSNYPDCKHAIKAKPTGRKCKMCDSLMMEGTKTIPERCSNKACPMHNPHKMGSDPIY